MWRFKGLDDKSTDFVLKVAEKRRKALQIGFFDYLFVCKDWNASPDELFCGGWVEMVAMPMGKSASYNFIEIASKSLDIIHEPASQLQHEDLVCGLQQVAVCRRARRNNLYFSHNLIRFVNIISCLDVTILFVVLNEIRFLR